jgi:hypothetical protein
MSTMKAAISEAITDMRRVDQIVNALSVEQRAALEGKYLTLPIEVRSTTASKYPDLDTCSQYIVRQMVKEANGRLASQKRPVWYLKLNTEAESLKSGNKEIRGFAEDQLRNLAEDLDSKESTVLLKKYKNAHDLTSKDAFIMQLCGIFGVSPQNLA